MKHETSILSTKLFTILFYTTGFVVFIGLFATVGVNMLLSHLFFSTTADPSYVAAFQHVNGTLFWWSTLLLLFFGIGGVVCFRFLEAQVLTKKPLAKRHIATALLQKFFYHLSIVVVLCVISWVGIQHVLTTFSDATTTEIVPTKENESVYEHSGETAPFEFPAYTVVRET